VSDLQQFEETVWDFYAKHARDLPWRHPDADGSFDPYKIWVSEIMLQQTQAPRVVPKYMEFLHAFPDVKSLSESSLGDVLRIWQGLGYNRRAKFLYQAAHKIMAEFNGTMPNTIEALEKLPGVGKNTAAAICAYAYNQPVVYIETNIRTVYIHHFFDDQDRVDDKDILPIVEKSLQFITDWEEQPGDWIYSAPSALRNPEGVSHYREWYWALMDYGSYLKKVIGNKSRQSKAYVKQSKFEGSRRQIRGLVVRYLSEQSYTMQELQENISDERLEPVMNDLEKEGFIKKLNSKYVLS
jgi:A/G-specific adenine glycosylase